MIQVVHPGSGSQIQGSKRYRIPNPDPQHCFLFWICIRILGFMNQKPKCFRQLAVI
jgi:hypothetical protein